MKRMLAGWGIALLASAALAEPMETRLFFVGGIRGDCFCEGHGAVSTNHAAQIREWWTTNGVTWPAGSAFHYVEQPESVLVVNTASNLGLIGRLMPDNMESPQVEIEIQFVAFASADIEPMAVRNEVNLEALLDLWSKGKGKLVCNPKVLARSGNEATVRGVREFIYPTSYDTPVVVDGTNRTPVAGEAVPADFETREEGGIFSVITEVDGSRTFMNLNLRPEWVSLSEWQEYGKEGQSRRQPVFYRNSVETQIRIANGQRLLLGGGVPGKEKDTLVYTFITARLLSTMSGKRP